MRDQADTVLVGVKQVAAVNLDPADHHCRAEIDQAYIGMADARVQAKELEPEGLDLVEVARAAAGDMPDTTELLVDRRGDLSKLGTQPRRLVQVPADRDLGAGHRGDVAQVVAQQVDLGFGQLRPRCAGPRSDRVADDRAQVRKQATDRVRQKPEMPRPDVEELDRVGDRRRIVSPQSVKLCGGQNRCRHERSPSVSIESNLVS